MTAVAGVGVPRWCTRRRVVAWSCVVGVSLLVALTTEVGPVIVSFGDHGVHVGDVVVVVAASAVALVVGR